MTIYSFSALADGTHITFNADLDSIIMDIASLSTSALRFVATQTPVPALGLAAAGRTIWLDGLTLESIRGGAISFADGTLVVGDDLSSTTGDKLSQLISLAGVAGNHQLVGFGGADTLVGGNGDDWIVAHGGPSVGSFGLTQVSAVGTQGAPTATYGASISADGRFVVFSGGWTGFGSSNNNAQDIIVKDMATGFFSNEHKTFDGQFALSGSGGAQISTDGSTVVCQSFSGLVPGVNVGSVYATEVGGTGIEVISSVGGASDNGNSFGADFSADARFVVFASVATNLAGGSAGTTADLFVKDRDTGSLVRVTTSLTGGDANDDAVGARISGDGRYVVFSSAATNLTSTITGAGQRDIYLWDATLNNLTNLTAGTPGNASSGGADVAADGAGGAYVVFETTKALVAGDTNGQSDIYAWSTLSNQFTRISTTATGAQVALGSTEASVSADGHFVVFRSFSDALVAGDSNGVADIFLKDTRTGAIALISAPPGGQANQSSRAPEISADGVWIVFETSATNLSATNTNGALSNIFRVANPLLRTTLQGGRGDDTYIVSRAADVIEAANQGHDTVRASLSWSLGANIEDLILTGGANTRGTGNALGNVLTGNRGNNVLDGGAGNDTASFMQSTAAVSVSLAVAGAQTTGAGNDTLLNIENLTGSRFNDHLTGDGGANRLDGGAGSDSMTGGEGSDTYICNAATDVVIETGTGAGERDTVISGVNWTLGARLENLTLTGAAVSGGGNNASNVLRGNGLNNVISAAGGDDTVFGGAGNDSLTGGAGNDQLTGGQGADSFCATSTLGSDVVTDFRSGQDRFVFVQSTFGLGDGDLFIEAGVETSGIFAPSAELVILTLSAAGLTTADAAARIGSATADYALGQKVAFVVRDSSSTAVFQFVSDGADSQISAGELTLLATLQGTTSTHLADYLISF